MGEKDKEQCDEIIRLWKKPWGDRRQEIVIIGKDMNRDLIISKFDSCLLNDDEMELGPEIWRSKYHDPFPEWRETMENELPPDMEKTIIRN